MVNIVRRMAKWSGAGSLACVLTGAVLIGGIGTTGLLYRWWQDVTGAEALAQTQAPTAPTIPVVRPQVQSVSETMVITGNAGRCSR